MTDNVAITAGSGTSIATDQIGSDHHQRVKVTWGVDGTGNDTNLTTPIPVQLGPVTTGGLTIYTLTSAASTNSTNVKASAGQLYAWHAFNTTSNGRYVLVYNKASAPTVGSDTPVILWPLAGLGGVAQTVDAGLAFSLGIGLGITTAANGTGAVGAGDVIVNLYYK